GIVAKSAYKNPPGDIMICLAFAGVCFGLASLEKDNSRYDNAKNLARAGALSLAISAVMSFFKSGDNMVMNVLLTITALVGGLLAHKTPSNEEARARGHFVAP